MEQLICFEWIQYDFMKNALLAIICIVPLFGILGTMIVNNKLAFFSDALGHSAFTGMAIGVILGVSNVDISMVIFGIIFAIILNFIKSKKTASTDTIISVFASLSTAIGLVILSRGGNFANYSSLLVGDILSITIKEIIYLLVILVVTIVFWLVTYNQLHAVSMSESIARSRHIKVKIIETIFSILIALVVMCSIKWVGMLIINALLILPAAASRNISNNIREYHLFSVMISFVTSIMGLIVSYYIDTATGPTIAIFAALVFFSTLVIKPYVK
ncbi:MAG: metal ABC transporter permease [Lachnospiraceae bacterium]|nr:metal ABC transporter permease [Lachnospiraceae bacterium]